MKTRIWMVGVLAAVAVSVCGQERDRMCLGGVEKGRFEVRDISWPERVDAPEICLWKGDKVAACSLTIDDNCKPDLVWWKEMCEKYDLVVTHFLITDRVGGRNKGFDGTWEEWSEWRATGRGDLQTHTRGHIRPSKAPEGTDLEAAYVGSKEDIESHVEGARCLAMAAPYGEADRELVMANFVANRGTRGAPNVPNMIDYANVNTGPLSQAALEVITTGHTDGEPKWMNQKRYFRGWISPLYHFVKGEQVPVDNPSEEGLKLLAGMAERIWIGFFVDIARYGQERDTAKLTVEVSEGAISLVITDEMKDDFFDVPLTVKVRLPEGWRDVKATQAGAVVGATVVEHEGARFALVDCVPDRGATVVVRK